MNASSNHDSTKTLDSQNGLEKKSRFKVKNLTPEETYHEQQKADAPVSDADSKVGAEDSKELGIIMETSFDPTKGSMINIPKKSRFTVKTVPKDEERNELVSEGLKINLPPLYNGVGVNENQQQTFDTYLAQSATIQRLERLLELSTNMLSKLVNTNATIGTTTPGSLEASLASRTVDFAEGVNSQPVSFTRDRSISRATDTDIAAAGAGQKGTSGFVTVNAIAGATTPGPISATPSSYVDKSDKIDRVEKEKSFAKMAHYISELKRELDVAQKQRKDASLETQGLRDKCQQLEDRLSVEQARAQGLEERLDRAKGNQRLLQAQIDAQSLKIVEQETIISNFSSKSNDIGVAGSANSNNNANIAVGSLLVTENNS